MLGRTINEQAHERNALPLTSVVVVVVLVLVGGVTESE